MQSLSLSVKKVVQQRKFTIDCAVYVDCTPSYITVIRWSNEFRRGRESLEDDPRSGRPSDAVNPSVIAAVEKLVRDDRRIKVLDVARTMQISCGSA